MITSRSQSQSATGESGSSRSLTSVGVRSASDLHPISASKSTTEPERLPPDLESELRRRSSLVTAVIVAHHAGSQADVPPPVPTGAYGTLTEHKPTGARSVQQVVAGSR